METFFFNVPGTFPVSESRVSYPNLNHILITKDCTQGLRVISSEKQKSLFRNGDEDEKGIRD